MSDLGDLGQAALKYAGLGWLIYPQKADKSPITAHGIGDATADLRLVYAWWQEWPHANIALATGASGIVGVDMDLGKDGPAHWLELCAELGLTIRTREVRSGGGGGHLYFTLPWGVTIRGGTDKLGLGVDVICNRMSLTLPPSVHASGNRYEWLNDYPMQEFPGVLVSRLLAPPPSVNSAPPARSERGDYGRCVAYLQRLPDAINGSGGHSATFRAACEVWKFGLSDGDAWDAMRWWNATKCKPQWGERELRHKLDSALGAVGGDVGVRNRTNGNGNGHNFREESEDEKALALALTKEIEQESTLVQMHPGQGKTFTFDTSATAPKLNGNGHVGPALRHSKKRIKSALDEDGARRPVIRDHELRNLWLDKHRIDATHYDTSYGLGEWRRYANGLWLPVEENAINHELQEIIDMEARIDNRLRPSGNLLRSVRTLVQVEVRIADKEWDRDINLLVASNGVVDLRTRALLPHSPDYHCTSGVPYAYDPTATASAWAQYMAQIFPDAAEFLQEFAGYCTTTDTRYELAVWLYGEGGGGKSTFIAGLTAALAGRWEVISLNHLDKSAFALSKLAGKTLMISTEQPGDYSGSMHLINAIISGEPVYVDLKYREPMTIFPCAKLLWAMNDLPRITDPNNGIFRRAKIIHLPKIEKKDPTVKMRVVTEGAGILNWALDGLDRLRMRGEFVLPESIQKTIDEFKTDADVEMAFINEKYNLTKHPDDKIRPADLYSIYRDWCLENGHKPKSSTRVARDWSRIGLSKRIIDGYPWWAGIDQKFKPNIPTSLTNNE